MRVVAGRYHLLMPLGAGGAGTVWRARDDLLRREVAVKEVRLPQELQDRDTALIDTLREARAAAALNHPAIITVHDVIAEHGQPWIIMDLLAGKSLGDLVKERGPLAIGHVATIGLRVLDALEAAHARGILHRDVKPGNVMITDAGEVILTDFGIAAHWSDAPGAATAMAAAEHGKVTGSPGYIAPEHLRGEPAGPAADLWSLAATLFTAVEGRPPFHRDSMMAVIAAVLSVPPDQPHYAGPLAGLLLAMLDKNPGARPHPQVVRSVLQPLALPLPTRRPDTAPATVPVRARRSKLPLALLGLAAGTAAAVTTVVLVNTAGGTTVTPTPSANLALTTPTTSSSSALPTTTVAPPQAKRGDGTFGQAPEACTLLTDEQVQEAMPGVRLQESSATPVECNWTEGVVRDVLEVRIRRRPNIVDAEKYLAQIRANRESQVGQDQGTTTEPVRNLDGVGDEAFGQNEWAVSFPQAHSKVWLRYSNLIIEIDAADMNRAKLTARQKNAATTAARTIADNLRKLT